MVDLANPQTQVLLFIPAAGALLYFLSKDESKQEQVEVAEVTVVAVAVPEDAKGKASKEANFLRFNQDGIYGNLLATEEHFRNIKEDVNFNQCSVKHLALAENHADEAVSHSIAVGDQASSEKYASLRDNMRSLRHDIQDGKINANDGIVEVRKIKKDFESFNQSFDVSQCKACSVG